MKRAPFVPHRTSRSYIRDQSGAAAVELALWLGIITLPLLNAVEIGMYAYQRMQVEQAAQMAVQQIYNACSQSFTAPYLTNCTTAATVADYGAQSTSLGSNVTVTSRTEGDYCVVSGALTTAGCGTTGHYVLVSVQYSYTPIFGAASVASLLSRTMTRTHYIRMI